MSTHISNCLRQEKSAYASTAAMCRWKKAKQSNFNLFEVIVKSAFASQMENNERTNEKLKKKEAEIRTIRKRAR